MQNSRDDCSHWQEQHPRSHHKGATDANATGGKGRFDLATDGIQFYVYFVQVRGPGHEAQLERLLRFLRNMKFVLQYKRFCNHQASLLFHLSITAQS